MRRDALGPWRAFLHDLDGELAEPTELHCLGGFVLAVQYGLPRPTGDLDYLAIVPRKQIEKVEEIAGRGSALARRHKLHVQYVGITTLPENHEDRLVDLLPGEFRRLRLKALDPYDLALSKLERNSPKDLEDIAFLAARARLEPQVLRQRYEQEMRPYLANEARHDLTLKLWLELRFPTANQS